MKEETPPKTAEEFQKYIIVEPETGIKSQPFDINFLLDNMAEFDFENGESLPLKDFIFFRHDYELKPLPASTPTSKQEGEAKPTMNIELLRKRMDDVIANTPAEEFIKWFEEQGYKFIDSTELPATQQEGRRVIGKLEFDHEKETETYTSCLQEGRREEAVEILKELCQLKHYKDTVGKDSVYVKNQPLAWERANDYLNSLVAASIPPNKGKEAESEKVRVLFGLEAQGHIPTIEAMLKEWGQSSYHIWNEIGKKIGWCPLTACAWYLEYILNKQVKEE